MLVERSYAALPQWVQSISYVIGNPQPWNQGNEFLSDLCDEMFAPNPASYLNQNLQGFLATYAAGVFGPLAASSMHPGGFNTVFADGSVHFIKNTISSWSNSTGTYFAPYFPPASYFISTTPVTLTSAAVEGVWQKLGSKNWGEVISSDSY